ncbi:MAG: PhoH family protein [Acidiferrobacterales bacterium]
MSQRVIEFSLTPADNVRLASVCGLHDEHLRQIEKHLGVEIANRGNVFRVTGHADVAQSAERVLKELYKSTAKNNSLTPSGVHVALQQTGKQALPADEGPETTLRTPKRVIKACSSRQRQYIRNILSHDVNFGIGPAGTGKTYLAVACAVDALENNQVDRIVLVRPAVEAGERLGFLPGDLGQKVDPYLRPLYDALHEMLGFDRVAKLLEKNIIELAPLAYMRGRSLNESFIILDEAQNTTPEQMKMFLTRIGFGTTAVVTGDITQIDLPRTQQSGLKQVMQILHDVKDITFTHFTPDDVVRNPLVQRIVEAYDVHERATEPRQSEQK